MWRDWRWAAVLLSLCLSGCATPGVAGSASGESGHFANFCRCAGVSDLLTYQQRLRTMNGEELAVEHASAHQNLARQKSDGARLRLALLLSLPGTAFRDDVRAAVLAEEVIGRKSPDSSTLWPLATLIAANAYEQRRQDERNQKLAQKLQEEEKRADALQQKLDGLKAIEKNLLNREPAKPVNVK